MVLSCRELMAVSSTAVLSCLDLPWWRSTSEMGPQQHAVSFLQGHLQNSGCALAVHCGPCQPCERGHHRV